MILRFFLMLFVGMWVMPGQADLVSKINTSLKAGVGLWHQVPFGQMRLLSCTSGVKDLAMAVGGLQVQLKPDWVMKQPRLEPLQKDKPSWMENPVVPGDGLAPVYQGEIVFPIVALRNPKDTKDFIFGVQGDFPACHEGQCSTFPIRAALPLPADSADYTSVCGYLIDQQRHVPLPGDLLGVKGAAWEQGGVLHFAFTGVKGAHIAFLQTLKQPFEMLETRLEGSGVLMRVATVPWAVGQTQNWILVSDRGIFKVPVEMKKGPVSLPPAPINWKMWLLGWELFFLTPLFIWWGIGCKKTKKVWQQSLVRFAFLLPIALILKVVLNQFIPFAWPGYAVVVLGAACLFPPQRGITALVLFLLWPYFPDLPIVPVHLFVMWLIAMWVEVMLPFVFAYLQAGELSKILNPFKKKNFFVYNLIFLLPTVGLLGYALWQTAQAKITYENKLNPDGISVVCAEKACLSWRNIPKVTFISPKTVLGRTIQKIYNRRQAVIWQTEGQRVILPPGTTDQQTLDFMKNWQNYHVRRMP